ncbi:c-type cytochrome [Pseudomonas citronellolis]|uniref:c-type cytochrome n=1 Tax=Pseudomonas citronellolis TaxID=53408 RepID=UPI0023E44B86|nr:c-type cytochrome [Pseudomonas citronellolis]MDF3931120.1 c-type cytochrome [Pseudomonas citronellolis]
MKTAALALLAAGLLAQAPAFANGAEDLFKTKACSACHSLDKKLVGPAFHEVAAKYAGQGDAVAHLSQSIRKGSQGVWGPMMMPPNAVSDDEARTLAEWIVSLK